MKHIVGFGWAAAVSALVWIASPVVDAQRGPQNPEIVSNPGNPDEGLALTRRVGAAGATTFARPRGGGVPVAAPVSARASQRALSFLADHGKAFGLERASDVRLLRESAPDDVGIEHVRFQQLHQGIPVTAGQMMVHLKRDRVVAANSEILSDLPGDVSPTLLAAEATVRARELMARQRDAATASQLTYSEPVLEIFNRGLLQDGSFPTRLAWFVEASAIDVRQFIWVDAHSGAILLHFDQLTPARNRRVYTANNSSTLPGTLVRSEGGAATADGDVNAAYDFSGDTYNYFFTQHGRDSFDNAGGTLTSTVRYCPDAFNCPYGNAFWNGTQMVYGQGFSTADDVDAHELTHAVTEYSAGLFYYMQSGALNESYSDIFGETVDLTNGRGNDAASVRWKLGEDLPASIGIIRDMANPQAFGDPGKTSDPEFKCDYSSDGGGVHSNSGVPNHAYTLMVDGGTYNGKTVTAIGLAAAAKIHYRALTTYLTSGSNFVDHYNAVQQSCSDLVGVSGITSATCVQVKAALDAVQMNGSFCTNSPTPALCPVGQTATTIFADGFEGATNTNWSRTALQGTGLWSVPDRGWAKTGTQMAYGEDFGSPTDTVMSMATGVTLPAGAKLQFSHAYAFEQGLEAYDGGVIEYSRNGGAWTDAGSLIAAGDPYDATAISSCCSNPLAGRRGFVGNSYGYTASQLNLGTLAGSNVRFRFRIGTDGAVGDIGWVVDDFRLYTCGTSCSFSITPTSQAVAAAGGAGSIAVSASGTTCSWTAASGVSWITLGSTSGTGSGSVSYTVAANTGAARTGTITVAGKTFTVTQAAASSMTVAVTAPNGGEKVYAGTPYKIEWTASGAAKFDVSASTDGGVTYVAVPGCTALAGTARSCTWTAPGPQTINGRIKVTARDSGGATITDVSNAAFVIASGTGAITVTYPNTAVNVGIGSLQVIKWAHNLGAQSYVKIQLSRDGGVTYPVTLVSKHKNSGATSGSYNWRVTGAATTGAQARIRVTWTSGPATTDTSNINFTIAPAFITLTAPAAGANWGFTTTQTQAWATNLGEGDRVNVQLSTTGSAGAYTTMSGGANVIATKKTANVVVPSTATTTARVKVVWANAPAGFSAVGNNPANFIIQAPFISVTAPAAGALWQIGTVKALTWKSNLGVLENVAISLSKDGGATFPIALAASTPSDGTQTVTVNAAWGSQTTTRVRVAWLKAPTVRGTSANFTIQP